MVLIPVIIDYIIDGDTIKYIRKNRKISSRCRYIDCPEQNTEWGQKATKFLEDILMQGQLFIEEYEPDRYGRILADWFIDSRERNIQTELVKNGLAVDFLPRNFFDLNKRSTLLCCNILQAQYYARRDSLGIWSDKEFVVNIRRKSIYL